MLDLGAAHDAGPARARWRKALIKVGYRCNDHCTFCHTLETRDVEGSASEIHRKIARAAALGHDMVVLSGGEPTIRPELLGWASHVAALGMDFGLVTNGRMLAYPDLVEALLARRLRYVYLSLHGGSARVHDSMVRARAFDESRAALRTLAGRGLDVTVHCVVTRRNLRHLREVVDACLPHPDVALKLSMVEPKGGGAKHFDHLVPRVADVAAAIVDAIAYGRERASPVGPRFLHGGVPLCLVPGLEDAWDDLRTHGFTTMVEVGEPDFFPVDDDDKVQPEARCRDCALRGPCPGLYRAYLAAFGDGELRPVRDRACATVLEYGLAAALRAEDADGTHGPCPVRREGVTPWDRGRDLLVRRGPHVLRFRADGRAFPDAELRAIKEDRGQIYADVVRREGDARTPERRRLAPARRCGACVDRGRCTGLFELGAHLEPELADDDERVRALLETLRGDVLEIVSARAPHAEALHAGAASGRIHVRQAEPETLADSCAYDHVLLLFGWNELRDAEGAMRRVARALRAGGSLSVVDEAPFGLLRTPGGRAEGAAVRSATARWRRDDARAARRAIEGAGLVVREVRDVAPHTSMRWWIRADRPARPG